MKLPKKMKNCTFRLNANDSVLVFLLLTLNRFHTLFIFSTISLPPQQILGRYSGGSLTQPMLITA